METSSPPPVPPRTFKSTPQRAAPFNIQEECILCTIPSNHSFNPNIISNYDELLESEVDEKDKCTSTLTPTTTTAASAAAACGFQSLQSSPRHKRTTTTTSREKSLDRTIGGDGYTISSNSSKFSPIGLRAPPPLNRRGQNSQTLSSSSAIPKLTVIRDYIEENPIINSHPSDLISQSEDESSSTSACTTTGGAASHSHDVASISSSSHLPLRQNEDTKQLNSSSAICPISSSHHANAANIKYNSIGFRFKNTTNIIKSSFRKFFHISQSSSQSSASLCSPPTSPPLSSSTTTNESKFKSKLKCKSSLQSPTPPLRCHNKPNSCHSKNCLPTTLLSRFDNNNEQNENYHHQHHQQQQHTRGISSAFQTPIIKRPKNNFKKSIKNDGDDDGDENDEDDKRKNKRRSRSLSELIPSSSINATYNYEKYNNENDATTMNNFIEIFNQQTHERDLAQRVNPHLLLEEEVEKRHRHGIMVIPGHLEQEDLPPPLPPKASCSQQMTPGHHQQHQQQYPPPPPLPPSLQHHHSNSTSSQNNPTTNSQIVNLISSSSSSLPLPPLPLPPQPLPPLPTTQSTLPPQQLPLSISDSEEDDYHNEELTALTRNTSWTNRTMTLTTNIITTSNNNNNTASTTTTTTTGTAAVVAPTETCRTILPKPSFTENMSRLKKMGCYWGPLTQTEVSELLMRYRDGTFLLRDSEHVTYLLSAGLKANGRVFHARIEYSKGEFCLASHRESPRSACIEEFINLLMEQSSRGDLHFIYNNTNAQQDAAINGPIMDHQLIQVVLSYPLSRFSVVQSLSHLCRFEILLRIRHDHIDHLPLPAHLKRYLQESQYYAEVLHSYKGDKELL